MDKQQYNADMLALNEKYDDKIAKAEDNIKIWQNKKRKEKKELEDYYNAFDMKEKAEAIISKGKPVI